MKIEKTKVFNFEGAFRGMRNPLDSWKRADSTFGMFEYECDEDAWDIAEAYYGDPNWSNTEDYEELRASEEEIEKIQEWLIDQGIKWDEDSDCGEYVFIGPNDMNLAQKLIKGGAVHRKFLRQIMVSVDITAPLYWWNFCQ